jgi:hypothetical protein
MNLMFQGYLYFVHSFYLFGGQKQFTSVIINICLCENIFVLQRFEIHSLLAICEMCELLYTFPCSGLVLLVIRNRNAVYILDL